MGILSERLALPPASPRPCFFKFHVPIVRDCLYFASSLPCSLPWQPGRFIPRLSRFEAFLLPSFSSLDFHTNIHTDGPRDREPFPPPNHRFKPILPHSTIVLIVTQKIYIYIYASGIYRIYRADDDTLNTRDARKQDESAANDAIRAGAIQRRVYRVTFPSLISPPNESNQSSKFPAGNARNSFSKGYSECVYIYI